MEQEIFISGYCRTTDESRMVTAEFADNTLLDVDCCYRNCPHKPNCTIAKKIEEYLTLEK